MVDSWKEELEDKEIEFLDAIKVPTSGWHQPAYDQLALWIPNELFV